MSQPSFQAYEQTENQLDQSKQSSNLDVGDKNTIQYQQKGHQLWGQAFQNKEQNNQDIRNITINSIQDQITFGKSKLFRQKLKKNNNINLSNQKLTIQNTANNKTSHKYLSNKIGEQPFKQKQNVKQSSIATRSKNWVKEKDRKLFEIARTQFKRQNQFCYFSPKLL